MQDKKLNFSFHQGESTDFASDLREDTNALVSKIIDTFVREFKSYVHLRLTNCNIFSLIQYSLQEQTR